MVAYSFKRRFCDPILAGTKDQTMRDERRGRSRHARPGELVQLYYAMRTKHCRLLRRSTCSFEAPVWLYMARSPAVFIGSKAVPLLGFNQFARRDGFTDWDDLCRHWWDERKTREWSGRLIRWDWAHDPALQVAA